jgi:hypothetical protein
MKQKRSRHIFLGLIIGIGVGVVFSQFINLFPFNPFQKTQTQSLQMITYESKRAPFSFLYPNTFEIGVQSDNHVYQFDNRIEAINFGTQDKLPNAGGDGIAYLIVEKRSISGLSSEEELLQEYEDAIKNFGEGNVDSPTITVVKIGNADGIKVVQKPLGAFSFTNTKYYVDRGGLRFIIGIMTKDPNDLEQLESIFSTFNFYY